MRSDDSRSIVSALQATRKTSMLAVTCSFEAKEVGGRTQIWQDGDEVCLAHLALMQQALRSHACDMARERHAVIAALNMA